MVGSDALMRLSLVIFMPRFDFVERHIEIDADEDAFAVEIEIANGG